MKLETERKNFPPRGHSAGISLVEILVSMAVGILLLIGLTYIFAGSSRSNRELHRAGQQIENARYATIVLTEDIRHAGYYGEFYRLPAAGALPDPCAQTLLSLAADIAYPIQGYDSPISTPISSCLPTTEYLPGTDIVVVRRAQLRPLSGTDLPVPNDVYIQATGAGYDLQLGDPTSFVLGAKKADGTDTVLVKKNGMTAADIFKLNTHIYFLSPCSGSNCATVNDGIPTLKRLELVAGTAGPVWRLLPIAEGIENLQIEYGIDDSPTTPHPFSGQIGDGVPDRYETSPDATEWPNVIAVTLHLLSRNAEPTVGHTDAKTYRLGDVTLTPGGAFKRHVISTLIRVTNQGARRDS